LTSHDAAQQYKISEPKLLFCSKDLLETTRAAAKEIGISSSKIYIVTSSPQNIVNSETGKSLIGKLSLPWLRITDVDVLKTTTIVMLFSSGTTGPPK
jgi:acyl-CoA synthetase (AMP-forming)/AMP-acid ligase II